MNIYIVTIDGKKHYVRAEGKRQATAFAIDAVVETRIASHDDLVHALKHGHPIIGEPVIQNTTQELPLP